MPLLSKYNVPKATQLLVRIKKKWIITTMLTGSLRIYWIEKVCRGILEFHQSKLLTAPPHPVNSKRANFHHTESGRITAAVQNRAKKLHSYAT